MPKVTKIEDKRKLVKPLRVTHTKSKTFGFDRVKDASILVRCGCCNEKVRISHSTYDAPVGDVVTLEINGVYGTREQWIELLSGIN